MLVLDPSKRIPLASVLKHRWMEGVEVTTDTLTKCPRLSNASGESVQWNEQVLMAIQNMNYNMDACKQVHMLSVIYQFKNVLWCVGQSSGVVYTVPNPTA